MTLGSWKPLAMPKRASGLKFCAAATAAGSNPPKNVASATLNPSRYGVVLIARHRLLIEEVDGVQADCDAHVARQAEVLLQQQVHLRERRGAAQVAAAVGEEVDVLLAHDRRPRHAAPDERVHADHRAPRQVVGGLRLELVRPIGPEPPVGRVALGVVRVVQQVERSAGVRLQAADRLVRAGDA